MVVRGVLRAMAETDVLKAIKLENNFIPHTPLEFRTVYVPAGRRKVAVTRRQFAHHSRCRRKSVSRSQSLYCQRISDIAPLYRAVTDHNALF
jgi:hypothetical protein